MKVLTTKLNMNKMDPTQQQNRGNIWSQYFPHCLPSLRSPHLIWFAVTQSLVSSFPVAIPNFPLDISKENNDFLFIKKTARKESENTAFFFFFFPRTSYAAGLTVPSVERLHVRLFHTSGASVYKAGVRWRPATTVHESCVISILTPGLSPVQPLAHRLPWNS